MAADEKLFLWINGLVGKFEPFDRVMELVVSDYLVPVTLALTLVALWFIGNSKETRQRHQIGLFVALTAMALASLTVFTINALYFRDRPFVGHEEVQLLFYRPTDSSFPANAMAAAFGLSASIWGVNRRVGSIVLVWAGIWGFSRVYAGIHYPLDVITGAFIGIVWSFITFKARYLLGPILVWVIKAARILRLA